MTQANNSPRLFLVPLLFAWLCTAQFAEAKPAQHRTAKTLTDAPAYFFANNGLNSDSEWMSIKNIPILNVGDVSNPMPSSRPRLSARLEWNTSPEAKTDPNHFLPWACWNLLQLQQSPQDKSTTPMLEPVCSRLDKHRAYIVHVAHWAREADKFSLKSNDWFLYRADNGSLVQEGLTRRGKPAFDADADALLFGIQIFDSVNAEEKTLLKLVYTAAAVGTIPQNPQQTPQDAQAVAGANLKVSNGIGSEEALVIVGFIPRIQRSPYRLAVTSTLSVQEEGDSERPVVLRGHTISLPADSAPLERTPQLLENQLVVTIVLNRSNEPAFESFVREVNDPSSPRFAQFISQGQLAETYGPTAQAYDAVRSYLKRSDLNVIQDSPNRLTVSVRGGRELIERTFAVTIQDYRLGERTFFATKNDPSVPASVARYIQAIVGLSSLALPHPGIAQSPAQANPPDPNPIALATAYDFPGVGDGAGQTIGLLEYDNFNQSDLLVWFNAMKTLPTATMGRVKVLPVAGGTDIRNPQGEGEVLLDLEIVMGMAPGATYAVYEAPGYITFHQLVNAMVNDHVTVISNSWSECESALASKELDSLESVFAGGAASGISAFNATGDNGATCVNSNKKEVTAPADVLSAMGVGGTSLLVGTANSYGVESWWPRSGFGLSAHFVAPPYFKASLAAKNRPVPDFVADGDEKTGISVYQADKNGWYTAGGTSMSAPLWAAGVALMNQQLGPSGLVVSWVASTDCAKALHMPANMMGANNDFSHLGFGSIDLANLVKVKPACVKQH